MVIYPKLRHLVYVGDKERILPLVACNNLAKAHVFLDKALVTRTDATAGKAFNLCWNIPESELDRKIKYHSYSCSRAQHELGWTLTPWKDTVKGHDHGRENLISLFFNLEQF